MKKIIIISLSLMLFLGIGIFGIAKATDQECLSQQDQQDCQGQPDPPGCLLKKQIDCYNNKINDSKGQEKTLSSQITVMDSQIALTQLRIASVKQQIVTLTADIQTTNKKINSLEGQLSDLTRVLLGRIVATYEVGSIQPFEVLLSSGTPSDLLQKSSYLRLVQDHDKKLIYETQAAKDDYDNQKSIFEDKKQKVVALQSQLEGYTTELNSEKEDKKRLLAETQGSESNYEKLLATAQAQLASLSQFARSVSGGVNIISHSDLSDSWGKYYNQRDSNWGNNLIGLSNEQIWDVGCLMTSYAMVVTHYGGSLTPADVAANSGNFSIGTAYFNAPGPSANGHSVSYVTNPSLQQLRDVLNSGASVIAGMSANGGPYPQHYSDHWVVLRSVDGDSFKINDPEYQDARNVSLTDHYSGWTIIEARIYN